MQTAIIETMTTEKRTYERERGKRVRRVILAELVRREHAGEGPPLQDGLAEIAGVSQATISRHLKRLGRDGFVTWTPRLWRSLRLTAAGRIAAESILDA